MGLAVVKVKGRSEVQLGGKVVGAIVDVTFDNSYPTGGEAITAAQCGLKVLTALSDLSTPVTAGGTGKVCEFDLTNSKVKLLVSAAAASPLQEVANASDQSTVTRRCLALGF